MRRRLTGAASMAGLAATLAWTGLATSVSGQCDAEEIAQLLASDAAAGDNFGYSVAVSGDTVVVGARLDDIAGGPTNDTGSAYVFVRSGAPGREVWTEQAKLTASDVAGCANFGYSVALSGDTAVVGAYRDGPVGGATLDIGSAYVFVRSGEVWTQQAKLSASDAAEFDNFGISVAVSGDTAMVGAHLDNQAGALIDAGSAYVFTRSGTAWTQQAKLTAFDAAASDQFGFSVAVSGDTAVVGANFEDHAGVADSGSAYVFTRSGTAWTEQAKLTASDASTNDHFGFSVALSGDTAVSGAIASDTAGKTDNTGSAYIFVRTGPPESEVWTEQQKLIASDASAGDSFGCAVALSGDTAAVGACGDDDSGASAIGSAYVFTRSRTVWTEQDKLSASDATEFDTFGISVAVSEDTAVIGAPGHDHRGERNAGAGYVFDLSCCFPDLNNDDIIDGGDLGIVLVFWGRIGVFPEADLNQDRVIDGADLGLLLLAWGDCPR